MEASKHLAQRAQASADNMEEMTRDMHIISKQTKQEAVSMRIITLVTLFFLPGTFISVSYGRRRRQGPVDLTSLVDADEHQYYHFPVNDRRRLEHDK